MPRYDYRCNTCGKTVERSVSYDARAIPYPCDCGGVQEYCFPMSAIDGYQPFEPMYVEPLGCDVSGRRELRQILKDQGLQEAGDKVGGARNWDPKANNIMPQAPRGESYLKVLERRRKADEAAKAMNLGLQGE